MSHTLQDHEAMRQAVERLFREVVSGFSHARARTNLPGPSGAEGILELSCSLPGMMRIKALAGADQVDLYLGQTIWYEFVITRRHTSARVLDDVRKKLEAAVAGRFEEKLCEFRGEVVAERYVVHRPGGTSAWPLRLRPIFSLGGDA